MYNKTKLITTLDNILYLTNWKHYISLIDSGLTDPNLLKKSFKDFLNTDNGVLANLYDLNELGLTHMEFMSVMGDDNFYNDIDMFAYNTIDFINHINGKGVSEVIIVESIPVKSIRDNIVEIFSNMITGTVKFRFFNTIERKLDYIKANISTGDIVMLSEPIIIDSVIEDIYDIKHSLFIPIWGWTNKYLDTVTTNSNDTDVVIQMIHGYSYITADAPKTIDEYVDDIMGEKPSTII